MAIKTYFKVKKYVTIPPTTPFYIEDTSGDGGEIIVSTGDRMPVGEYSTDLVTWTSMKDDPQGGDYECHITLSPYQRVYFRAEMIISDWMPLYQNDFYHKIGGNIESLQYGSNFTNQRLLRMRSNPEPGEEEETSFSFCQLFSNFYLVSAAELLLPTNTLYGCYMSMFMDCGSLTAAPELPATTLSAGCYHEMFKNCTELISAPILPATTLVHACYGHMFEDCTSLINAPILPATTMVYDEENADWNGEGCYYSMFSGCTSLVNAPALPATTLADYCYCNMFQGCTSLTAAPALPATTLTESCYSYMFSSCTNLSSITVGATSWNTSYATDWLLFVSATGTFTKPTNTTIPTGTNGIPSGWTVVNV